MNISGNIKAGRSLRHDVSSDLVDLLRTLPQVEAKVQRLEPELSGQRYDALLEARFGSLPIELWVEEKTAVYPRDAREQLDRWQRSAVAPEAHPNRHFLVAAHTVSPGARQLLVDEGVGYFDQSGSLCLPFTGAYTLIDKPAARTPGRDFELFSEARMPVLQAMLLNPELAYTVHDLASRTGSSGATVSKLMSHLEREDWVAVEGNGPFKRRRLSRPGELLDAWVAAETSRLAHRRTRRFFVRGIKAMELPELVARAAPKEPLTPHFTAEAAAQHYAPFLTTWNVATMRSPPRLTDLLTAAIDAVEAQQGYNLLVIEDGLSALRFSVAEGPVLLASPVQTYVDLMCAPGRGPDAAKHLREQVLKF